MQSYQLLSFILFQLFTRYLVHSVAIGHYVNDLQERNYEPVNLELNRDYTQAELKSLFAQQLQVQGEPSQFASESISTIPRAKEAKQSENLEASVLVTSSSFCNDPRPIVGAFRVHVGFDGTQAHYSSLDNVDGFGYISLVRSSRQSFYSTAEFHRTNCAALDPHTMCSYYHHVVLFAGITVAGAYPGIKVGAIQPASKSQQGHPWVLKTCVKVKKGTIGRCPAPDLTQTVCRTSPIQVTTLP